MSNKQIVIDTEDIDTIIDSLAHLFDVDSSEILYFIINSFKNIDNIDDDTLLKDFINHIKSQTSEERLKNELNLYITCFHLSTRINKVNGKEPLYNLQKLLTKQNEISNLFKESGFNFIVEGMKIYCNYNDKRVKWDEFDSDDSYVSLIKSRFEGEYIDSDPDSCVNGVLFGDDIENTQCIEHIKKAPEIIQTFSEIFPEFKKRFSEQLKGKFKYVYRVKYKIPFKNAICDDKTFDSPKEKLTWLIVTLIRYCCRSIIKNRISNDVPIIRYDDNGYIDSENIIEYRLLD